jgi:hypothetical protein
MVVGSHEQHIVPADGARLACLVGEGAGQQFIGQFCNLVYFLFTGLRVALVFYRNEQDTGRLIQQTITLDSGAGRW